MTTMDSYHRSIASLSTALLLLVVAGCASDMRASEAAGKTDQALNAVHLPPFDDACSAILAEINKEKKLISGTKTAMANVQDNPNPHLPNDQLSNLELKLATEQQILATLLQQYADCESIHPPPTPSLLWGPYTGDLHVPEPEIAVGRRFLFQMQSGDFVAYPRDASGVVDFGNGYHEAITDVFAGVIQNINAQLDYPPDSGLHCDANDITDCVNEAYDSDVLYDEKRDRFWIMTALRANLYRCNPVDPSDKAPEKATGYYRGVKDDNGVPVDCHAGYAKYVTRYLSVAVTSGCARSLCSSEDPSWGFHTAVLAQRYGDWPQFMVHGDWVMLNQREMDRGTSDLFVANADDIASGAYDGTVLTAPVWKYPGNAFDMEAIDWKTGEKPKVSPTIPIYFTKMNGDNDGLSYLVSADGAKLIVYALAPSQTPGGKPVLIRPAVVDLGSGIPWNYVPGAWRDGQLHWAWEAASPTGRTFIQMYRIPVHHSHHTVKGERAVFAGTAPEDGFLSARVGEHDTHSYQMPILNVNSANDVVMEYARFRQGGESPESPGVRFAVLYHDHLLFSPSAVLAAGTGDFPTDDKDKPIFPGKGGNIDVASVVIDPLNSRRVWMSLANSVGGAYTPAIGAVVP